MTYDDFIKQFRALAVAEINDNASYVYRSFKDKRIEEATSKLKYINKVIILSKLIRHRKDPLNIQFRDNICIQNPVFRLVGFKATLAKTSTIFINKKNNV